MNKQPNSRNCFVCGHSNPAGIHVRFYEQEDGSILSRFIGSENHQGFPGRMHGGVITAILDETMGRSIMVRHGEMASGVTVEINVRFRQPVPLGVELTAVGRITEEMSRVYEGTAEIYLPGGGVAAEATGKFVKLQMERVGFDREREEWAVIPD